jgi:tetratricopeptide (TPR) repeat protein
MRRGVRRALCRRVLWLTATAFSVAVRVRSVVFNLVAAFVTVSGFTGVAAADDWETCRKTEVESLIAACTGAIESGKLHGNDLSTAYINRGVGWSAQGEYGKAIRDFNDAIESDRENAIAYYDIANAYTITHDYSQAIKKTTTRQSGYVPTTSTL